MKCETIHYNYILSTISLLLLPQSTEGIHLNCKNIGGIWPTHTQANINISNKYFGISVIDDITTFPRKGAVKPNGMSSISAF